MRIDEIIECCLDAVRRAQDNDEQCRTYWGKPPEYIFTVAIAQAISKLCGNNIAVELEKNIDEISTDARLAWGEVQTTSKTQENRVDISLSRTMFSDLDPYCIIEVKYAMYGLSKNTGKSDLIRMCQLVRSGDNNLKYGLFVQYYLAQSKDGARKTPFKVVDDALNVRKSAVGKVIEGKGLKFMWKQSQIYTKKATVHLPEGSGVAGNGTIGEREVAWAYSVSRISKPMYT